MRHTTKHIIFDWNQLDLRHNKILNQNSCVDLLREENRLVFSLHFRRHQPNNCRRRLAPTENWFRFDTPLNRHDTVFVLNFDFCPWKLHAKNHELVIKFLTFESDRMQTHIFTSHDFSWLQNGQLNWMSSGSMFLRFGGGFLFALRRPIFLAVSRLRRSLPNALKLRLNDLSGIDSEFGEFLFTRNDAIVFYLAYFSANDKKNTARIWQSWI